MGKLNRRGLGLLGIKRWALAPACLAAPLLTGCQVPPYSTASIQISFPQRAAAVKAASVRAASQGLVPIGWGAAAPQAASEVTCFAVTIGLPAFGAPSSCSPTNGSPFSFGPSVGFQPLSQSASFQLDPGPAREIRVLATAVPASQACPGSFSGLNPLQAAQVRQVGLTTVDIAPGANTVNMTLDFTGPTIDSCAGQSAFAVPQANAAKCNFLASSIASGTFLPNKAIALLQAGASPSGYLASIPPSLAATVSGKWADLDSYFVTFASSGDLVNDLNSLCQGGGVSFVEPVTALPTRFAPTKITPRPQATLPIYADLSTGIVTTSYPAFNASSFVYTNPYDPYDGIDNDLNGFIDDTGGWNFVADSRNVLDVDWLGTATAGVVLQQVGVSLTATAPPPAPAQYMPIVISSNSSPIASAQVASAILFATQSGASVIGLSDFYGMFVESMLVARAIAYAEINGALVVAGAGHMGENSPQLNVDQTPAWPGSYAMPLGLKVGSFDMSLLALAFWSYYGPLSVDLVAASQASTAGGTWAGDNISASIVGGTALLMKAARPDLSMYSIRGLILNSVTPYASLSGIVGTGGLVNSTAAQAGLSGATNSGSALVFYPQ